MSAETKIREVEQGWRPSAQKSYGKYIAIAISQSGFTERLGKRQYVTADGTDTRNYRSGQRRFENRADAIDFAKAHTDLWNGRLAKAESREFYTEAG